MTYDDHVDCDRLLNEAEEQILNLKAELKKKDELLFAYESVKAPVNPLLAENKRLKAKNEELRQGIINDRDDVVLVPKKIYDQFEKLRAELEQHRWISVNEKLPEKNGHYLAGDKNTVGEAYWTGEKKKWKFLGTTCEFTFDTDVIITDRFPTHWKPIILPEQALKQ